MPRYDEAKVDREGRQVEDQKIPSPTRLATRVSVALVVMAALLGATSSCAPEQPVQPSSDAAFSRRPTTDRSQIVFGRNGDIYVMNADGSKLRKFTSGARNYDRDPTWSPDGSKVLFVRAASGVASGGDIYVADADGSSRFSALTKGGHDSSPAWSPDGSKIAFVRLPGGGMGSSLWTMNADGTAATSLIDQGSSNAPAWSPDGSRIVFEGFKVSTHDLFDSDIYVMNADGSGIKLLTGSLDDDLHPSWSPDGTRIAYERHPLGGSENLSDIVVVGVDGSDSTPLIDSVADEELPKWSPDGSQMVFVRKFSDNAAILVTDLDQPRPKILSRGKAADDYSGLAWTKTVASPPRDRS